MFAFLALGIWQLERRTEKLKLIAAVDARAHAPATAAPGPAAWAGIDARKDAYRHVRVQGVFLHKRETTVQAMTELGAGYWVLTPLVTNEGWIVLVNRGFVPPSIARPHRGWRTRRSDPSRLRVFCASPNRRVPFCGRMIRAAADGIRVT